MRIFIIVLVLIFSVQSWTKADDIKDFEIEGMSVGDSALDYFSRNEIIDSINHDTTFKYKGGKFVQISTSKNSYELYEYVGLVIKPDDRNFIIYSISGQFYFGDKINECYKKQNIISKDIDDFVGENTTKDVWNASYKPDYSGKSKVKYIDYIFDDDSAIRVICYDMDKNFKDPNDTLYVAVNSSEFNSFLSKVKY